LVDTHFKVAKVVRIRYVGPGWNIEELQGIAYTNTIGQTGRNPIMRKSGVLAAILFAVSQLAAQPIQTRLNTGALLEPVGKIINGAGQDPAAFVNYWNVMHPQDKPAIFMTYIGLRDVTSDWADGLKIDLMRNVGKFVIPQIGLSMTVDGTPSVHYEQDVAAGLYDNQIAMFIDGLQSLAIPAYVRIGYEFNGVSWNGYQPATYKAAFTRIATLIRARGIEVATVWCFAMDGVMNVQDYYPGDASVDWWAIDMFSASHFIDPNASGFLDSARAHHKPVMIGETTPRTVGVLDGQQSWDQWFSAFFSFIHARPEVKAFCYINWNWSQYPLWQLWGDARLEQNAIVGGKFAGEMDSLSYLHASSERVFRKSFGSSDTIAPPIPGSVSVVEPGFPYRLTWNPVTDPSGLSHYSVYRNGVLSDYALVLPYSDKTIAAGDTITYAVSAMDRAGNESQTTAGLRITAPSTLRKALNGEFDSGTQNWQLSSYAAGAAATWRIDTNAIISGRNSGAVTITQVTGTNWHIQLWQPLTVYPGRKYRFTFKAKASSSKVIDLVLQQGASPYFIYLDRTHTLTTAVQTFTDSASINVADQAKVEFFLGTSGTAQVWIDSVSIIESYSGTNGVVDPVDGKPEEFALLQNYPNPFNPSTTIRYGLPNRSHVSLTVYNTLGQQVALLQNGEQEAGYHEVKFDGSGLSSGVYFYRLQAGEVVQTRKLLLIR
jgi:hypothetical protein